MKKKDEEEKKIGQIIKEEVERQGLGAQRFADMIHVARSNVYGIYERPSIDSGLLARISEALHHDFFSDLSRRVRSKLRMDPSVLAVMNMKLTSFYNDNMLKILETKLRLHF